MKYPDASLHSFNLFAELLYFNFEQEVEKSLGVSFPLTAYLE